MSLRIFFYAWHKASDIIWDIDYAARIVYGIVLKLSQGKGIQSKAHGPRSDYIRTKMFLGGLKTSIPENLTQPMQRRRKGGMRPKW